MEGSTHQPPNPDSAAAAAAAFEYLAKSPDAVALLMQKLKAAAERSSSGGDNTQQQQPSSQQAGRPSASGGNGGASAGASPLSHQSEAAVLSNNIPAPVPQQSGAAAGTNNSNEVQQQPRAVELQQPKTDQYQSGQLQMPSSNAAHLAAPGTCNSSQPAHKQQQQISLPPQIDLSAVDGLPPAEAKQLLLRLLSSSQQQQPQPQPQHTHMPAHGLPAAAAASADRVHAGHCSMLPPAGGGIPAAAEVARHHQPPVVPAPAPPASQDGGLVDQLRSSLVDILKATLQQHPHTSVAPARPQQTPYGAMGAGGGYFINGHSTMAAGGAPMHHAPQHAAPGPRIDAATLAAALGLQLPPNSFGNSHGAAADVGVSGLRAHGQAMPPQAQHPNGNSMSMPLLLDSLRSVVVHTVGTDNSQSAETQRLLTIVDQLQSAWHCSMASSAAAAPGTVPLQNEASTTSTYERAGAAAGPVGGAGGHEGTADIRAEVEGADDTTGLHMLLEAVQQQAHLAADSAGAGEHEAGDDGHLHHGSSGGAGGHGEWGTNQQQQQLTRKRSWGSEQQPQLQSAGSGGGSGNNLAAAVVAAMMRQEGMPVDPAVTREMEQKWLLKPRRRGKRQVKLNKVALTGELPPVADRWAGKARRTGAGDGAAAAAAAAAASSDDEDELWKPPRVRPAPAAAAPKRRRGAGGGSEDAAAGPSDGSPPDHHLLKTATSGGGSGSAGAKAAAGGSGGAAQRRGYGWQLLQQVAENDHQQADKMQSEMLSSPSPTGGHGRSGSPAQMRDGSIRDGSRSSSGEGTGDGLSPPGEAWAEGLEGGAAALAASGGVVVNSTSPNSGVPKPRKPAVRKERWVPPTEEWTSDDGLKVWPKDTQICPAARVFYVAFKWVQDNWPNNLAAPDNHITSHPIRFYVDGHDTEVELTAKLRLYRKAVHLVISPYSALAKRFVRKWLAGYAFDPEKQVLRAYLSTLKPKPPRVQEQEPDPEQLTAAAAAAAEFCNSAAAQFASGSVAVDAQQQLAAQLAALANMLQPKAAKGSKQRVQQQPPQQSPQQLQQAQQQQLQGQQGQLQPQVVVQPPQGQQPQVVAAQQQQPQQAAVVVEPAVASPPQQPAPGTAAVSAEAQQQEEVVPQVELPATAVAAVPQQQQQQAQKPTVSVTSAPPAAAAGAPSAGAVAPTTGVPVAGAGTAPDAAPTSASPPASSADPTASRALPAPTTTGVPRVAPPATTGVPIAALPATTGLPASAGLTWVPAPTTTSNAPSSSTALIWVPSSSAAVTRVAAPGVVSGSNSSSNNKGVNGVMAGPVQQAGAAAASFLPMPAAARKAPPALMRPQLPPSMPHVSLMSTQGLAHHSRMLAAPMPISQPQHQPLLKLPTGLTAPPPGSQALLQHLQLQQQQVALQQQQQEKVQVVFVPQGTSASGQPLMVPMMVVAAAGPKPPAAAAVPGPKPTMVTQH